MSTLMFIATVHQGRDVGLDCSLLGAIGLHYVHLRLGLGLGLGSGLGLGLGLGLVLELGVGLALVFSKT